MEQFKYGDKVVRHGPSYDGVEKGKYYTVRTHSNRWLCLEEFASKGRVYDGYWFELYKEPVVKQETKNPRPHAELIKAWADGASIQHNTNGHWADCANPGWAEGVAYRVKPEVKPDVVHYGMALARNPCTTFCSERHHANYHNLKLTFDGDTGKLKTAEVIG